MKPTTDTAPPSPASSSSAGQGGSQTPGPVPGSPSKLVHGASWAQRVAWFCGGVGCALALLTVLDSAAARPFQDDGGTGTGSDGGASLVPQPLPMGASGVTGDSNNRMIAVTGNDITGQSVLYLVDTIDKQLAVYQASGGSPGTQSVKLVGARNISLDLQLDGLNDKTVVDKQPLTYKDLAKRFDNDVDGNQNGERTTRSGAPR